MKSMESSWENLIIQLGLKGLMGEPATIQCFYEALLTRSNMELVPSFF